jgi:hypothetical protein
MPEQPGTEPLRIDRDGFTLEIVDDDAGTHLRGEWAEGDRRRKGCLDVSVARPPGHESLNVVIPWSDDTFNFTSKHQARPATGALTLGDRRIGLGLDGNDAWGVLDVGRGRWPREITWNWGSGAGRAGRHGRHVVGLQIGGKWTEGTGFTENGIIVDGHLTKLGSELVWDYDWNAPMQPWRVRDPDGHLDIVLTPRFDKHSRTAGYKRGSETHQVFGTWSGRVVVDGHPIKFEGLQGFAEEARQNW